MIGKLLAALAVGLCLLVSSAFLVYAQVPAKSLEVAKTTPVENASADLFMTPIHCDSTGNIYFRKYLPTGGLQVPVVRISADGRQTLEFSIASVPGFQGGDTEGFAVGLSGDVVLAVSGEGPNQPTRFAEGYLIRFDGTGALDSIVNLGAAYPLQVALFPNGNLLVSGTKDVHLYGRTQPSVQVGFTELLNSAGAVIKTISLPRDVRPPRLGDPDFQNYEGQFPSEMTLGDAVVGNDGNAYLMRHMMPPIVYVISSDGSLLRMLRLEPPRSNARFASAIQYSPQDGGELAVAFDAKSAGGASAATRIFSIYNAETGQKLANYPATQGVGAALACYTPKGFTFIGWTMQHELALKLVEPAERLPSTN